MTLATINTLIVSPISDLRESPTIEKFKISIQVIGIKKRCRKNDKHRFQLGSIDYNNGSYDRDAIDSLVRAFIDTNMKDVNSMVRVSLSHVKVKNEGGFTSTLWEPFSDKNLDYNLPY